MQNRNFLDYLVIGLKGMAMGAADVVPGVSGGTIAFISGIYEELLDSINAINLSLFKVLRKEGFKEVWKKVNGNFLLSLLLGIGISVVSLAKLLSWLLENEPVLLWSFFFGLVLASILYVGKQISKWNYKTIIAIVLAAFFAYFVTQLDPITDAASSPLYLVLSGALAISAMILPGLSGSFVLVLLGVYPLVLNAVHQRELSIISLVGAGAVIGLLSFARVLKYIFIHYRDTTLAVLTGFIIGALNKIWPWKNIINIKEVNVSPFNFAGDNQLLFAILLALIGFLLIILLEKWGKRQK